MTFLNCDHQQCQLSVSCLSLWVCGGPMRPRTSQSGFMVWKSKQWSISHTKVPCGTSCPVTGHVNVMLELEVCCWSLTDSSGGFDSGLVWERQGLCVTDMMNNTDKQCYTREDSDGSVCEHFNADGETGLTISILWIHFIPSLFNI